MLSAIRPSEDDFHRSEKILAIVSLTDKTQERTISTSSTPDIDSSKNDIKEAITAHEVVDNLEESTITNTVVDNLKESTITNTVVTDNKNIDNTDIPQCVCENEMMVDTTSSLTAVLAQPQTEPAGKTENNASSPNDQFLVKMDDVTTPSCSKGSNDTSPSTTSSDIKNGNDTLPTWTKSDGTESTCGSTEIPEESCIDTSTNTSIIAEIPTIKEVTITPVPVTLPRPPNNLGLCNLGNTCYLNSAIQMLFSIPEFVQDLEDKRDDLMDIDEHKSNEGDNGPKEKKSSLRDSLFELSRQMKIVPPRIGQGDGDTSLLQSSAVDPSFLKKIVDDRCCLFEGYLQQDSHEFLSTLLDLLHDEIVEAKKNESSENKAELDEEKQNQDEPAVVPIEEPLETDDSMSVEESNDDLASQTEDQVHPTIEEELKKKNTNFFPLGECEQVRKNLQVQTANKRKHASPFCDLDDDAISSLLHDSPRKEVAIEGHNASSDNTQLPQRPPTLLGGRANVPPFSSLTPLNTTSIREGRINNEDNRNSTNATSETGVDVNAVGSDAAETTESAEINTESKTPVEEHFGATVEVRLTCDSCCYTRTKTEQYRYFSIDISSDIDGEKSSVEEGLRKFFAPEKRELRCEKCFCETSTEFKRILTCPRALLLHFKRFIVEFSPIRGVTYRKNRSCVEFGHNLDLTDYTSASCSPCDIGHGDEDDDSAERSSTQEACSPHLQRKYRLKSLVHHIGSTASCGHYKADCLRQLPHSKIEMTGTDMGDAINEGSDNRVPEEQWMRLNDGYVSNLDAEDAPLGTSAQETAYMVMYELTK